MKKVIILLLLSINIFAIEVFAQDLNKIGAAGIAFLIGNSKTSAGMSRDEKLAISLLGSFLNEKGNRQHELNVANAGKTEMVLQANDGTQIKLVRDQGIFYKTILFIQ